MKIRYLKLKNWLILSLMGLLGINGCHSAKQITQNNTQEDIQNEIILMYGVPARDYREITTVPSDSLANPPDSSKVKPQQPRPEMPAMYGVPTVNFRVKGRVIDTAGKPVKGVQVILLNNDIDAEPGRVPETEYMLNYIKKTSDTTTADGSFECNTSDRPWQKQRLLIRDIDGNSNGEYADDMVTIEFPKSQNSTKEWDLGTSEKEVTVVVKKKK